MAFGEMFSPGSGFDAMMGRFYDEMGNVQERNKTAFGYYEDEKKRDQDKYMADVYERNRQRKMQEEDRLAAENDRRRAINERVSPRQAANALVSSQQRDRNRLLHASSGRVMGGGVYSASQAPHNVLADFYEYGAGNPQGRGGGADAKSPSPEEEVAAQAKLMNCPPGMKQVGNQCLQHNPYSMG